ncbi:MAG: site-specific integrase [Muribaculaceae bacterium]|nr:site-specific integrase [Muribaculaceae bacterium]
MNRLKQKVKIKEPVRLRAKLLANGNQSLYLDTYRKGKREYEFLKLYLIPEKTADDKAINAATMKAAMAIKAKRILASIYEKGGIKNPDNSLSIKEWIEKIIMEKDGKQSVSSIMLMKRLIKHLHGYRSYAKLTNVNREFCIGFADYLKSAQALNSKKQLMQATQFELLNALSIVLNEAVRAELITSNPMRLLNAKERIQKPESTREYLTPEEVKSIIEVSADHIAAADDIAAFLFCCFCGLRYSDIYNLTWENIVDTDCGRMIVTTMKKTRRQVKIPISGIASSFLPESGAPQSKVFSLPAYGITAKKLKKIATAAGIKKK